MCSLDDAKSDFESLIKLKPNHTTAGKELASLDDLQAAFQQLQQLQQAHSDAAAAGGPMPDASNARAVLDKVYGLAPDCIPAQLLDAQLDMWQGNYEQVGLKLWLRMMRSMKQLQPAVLLQSRKHWARHCIFKHDMRVCTGRCYRCGVQKC
jgi:hypothetical protein